MKYLAINCCPCHRDFLSIVVEDEDHGGVRVTPGKCCGRWETVTRWPIDESMAETVIDEMHVALEACERDALNEGGR